MRLKPSDIFAESGTPDRVACVNRPGHGVHTVMPSEFRSAEWDILIEKGTVATEWDDSLLAAAEFRFTEEQRKTGFGDPGRNRSVKGGADMSYRTSRSAFRAPDN